MEKRVYRLDDAQWKALRPSLTKGVLSAPLLPESEGPLTVSVVRVAPGGAFENHRDTYHHVFYFMEGAGECRVGGDTHMVGPGIVVQVPAGTEHSYRNSSSGEMVLLALNVPAKGSGGT